VEAKVAGGKMGIASGARRMPLEQQRDVERPKGPPGSTAEPLEDDRSPSEERRVGRG